MTEESTAATANLPRDWNDLPDPFPILTADEVHVWQAGLDDHAAELFQPLLTEDENSRAARFHFARDRNHYVVARGLLRKLLAGYLGVDPAGISLAYAEKGKPGLAENQGSLLQFNLAHSRGKVVYAFSLGRAVGVDLEFMREDLAGDRIAERFFSPTEIGALATVPPELKEQAFFDCWTRKEAYIKARGAGLSMPLDEFDVSCVPGQAAALLRHHKEPAEVMRWRMQTIPAPSGYVAALVVEGQDWELKSFCVAKTTE